MADSEIHPAIARGKVAVITGGASGIGLAAAHRLSSAGMRVCLIDVAHALPGSEDFPRSEEMVTLAGDVSDRSTVDSLAGEIAGRFGPVSVLMNNAGIGGGGDALSNPEGWERLIGVNLMGVLHGVQSFVPAMIESGEPGLVVNTGSKQGITSPPGDTAYNVTKAGVKILTEGLEHTLRERTRGRISAHLLIPGFTYTGMIKRRLPNRPPGAWSPEQVVDRMMEGIGRGDFYILCQDNETTRDQDERRIAWAADDILENRPALSRWHPDWQHRYVRFMDHPHWRRSSFAGAPD